MHIWGPEDFAVGDFVAWTGGRWHEIARINPKSVSVAGLFDIDSGRVQTMARLTRRNHRPEPLNYDAIIGHLTAAAARERFPELFAVLDASPVRPRPKKKPGSVKLEHHRAPEGERWTWKVGDVVYTAFWRHPERWWRDDREPVTDPGVIRIKAHRPRSPGFSTKAEPVEVQIPELTIDGDISWVEEVHNQLRAHVQTHYATRRAA